MNEETKQKIINAVNKEDSSLKEVAQKLYISEHQLKMLLKSWGVDIRKKRKYNKIDRPERNELMKIYAELQTTNKVAKHFKVSVNTVGRWMKELKIPTRKMKMDKEKKIEYLEGHIQKLDDINL